MDDFNNGGIKTLIIAEENIKEMNKELKDIILAKCNERESQGYDTLTDSDIMDILEECERKQIKITRKELEQLGMD